MMPFHHLFPEIGMDETRVVTVPAGQSVPATQYAFVENYCVEPRCDCRRVVMAVYFRRLNRQVATINHAFDKKNADTDLGQTFLDPINPQSRFSQQLIELCKEELLADKTYVRRLEAHYAKVKRAAADPQHAIHARIAALYVPEPRVSRGRGQRAARDRVTRYCDASLGKMTSQAADPKPRSKPPAVAPTRRKSAQTRRKAAPAPVPAVTTEVPPSVEIPHIDGVDVRAGASDWSSWTAALEAPGRPEEVFLRIDYERLKLRGDFDELLAPALLPNIEKYWFQIEAVRKALRRFHGRVLLADEVGLGKTIEAGLLIKEYLLRGLARRVLILTPPSLVSQWREEMRSKFDLDFETNEDNSFSRDARAFWTGDRIIASLSTAKSRRHADHVAKQAYDIVVVDEAHHLRNRGTLAWQLVNRLQKRFLFLLSATPVQNNLIELFNLITLLKPGQFRTESDFRREYIARGAGKSGTGTAATRARGADRKPANKEKLRELLRDVMIRNTRSAIDLKMTRRFATTIRPEPSELEARIFAELEAFLREGLAGGMLRRPTAQLLLREAGSSPHALPGTIEKLKERTDKLPTEKLLAAIGDLEEGRSAKSATLLDLVSRRPDDKIVVFAQFWKSMDEIASLLRAAGREFALFRGDMSGPEKDAAVERFRNETPILLASESGGEGRNLQFANTLVNFDLPWNPMRIEQRIGRLHRIGQTRDVFVFNLAVRGTIEDHVIEILESKINMFEMVIGEIEPILGRLSEKRGDESEFEDLIFDLWASSPDPAARAAAFDGLGDEMASARTDYIEGRQLDDEIFGEEFES